MSATAAEHVCQAGPGQSTAAPPDLGTAPRWSRRVAIDIVAFLDVLAVVAGACVPALIYSRTGHLDVRWLPVMQAALISSAIVYGCLRAWGMYATRRIHDLPVMPARLAGALIVSALALFGVGTPFAPADVHMWVWNMTWLASSFTLILASRITANAVLASLAATGRFDATVAVYGAGSIARRVKEYLTGNAAGIRFFGVYDDRTPSSRSDPESPPIDGSLDDLIAAGRSGAIDQIIIALPQSADRRMATIASKLEQLPVSLHVVTHLASDLIDATTHKVSAIGSVGMLDVKSKPLSDWAPLIKRAEDYVLGFLLLVVFSPLMLLAAIAIRLDSPGPVLFRQRRRGLNHRVIEILKFRTMTVMEDGDAVPQATRHDPRTTRVGRFLRRTSIDELPQLINVLRGEMSLVGPRPHALIHDEKWGELLETYANRHQVKPGITGLAQVEGWRGETRTRDRMQGRIEHDLLYIRNWSLALDLKILFRTVRAVICAENAH